MRTAALVLLALAAGASAQEANLSPMTEGASRKLGGYVPQKITLTTEKLAAIKKEPSDLSAPLYGAIPFGGSKFMVIIDEPEGKPARMWVDSNGNGDLTDDGEAEWKGRKVAGRVTPPKEGEEPAKPKEYTSYNGGASLRVGTGGDGFRLNMYRFDPTDPARASNKDSLLYYRDYAYDGEITIAGKAFKAMLSDDLTTGDFRGKEIKDEKGTSGVSLLLDVNGNGKFDRRGEKFDARKPFNIGGTTWEIADMSASGANFRIVKSDKTVAEVEPSPDLTVGARALAFEAADIDGKAVKFPNDYKGKLVMIDFWATWCGPCMAEVPGLVKTYNKYHGEGFEILGISLDRPDMEKKVREVTAGKGMNWREVYDGGYWKAATAVLYDIGSIPAAFLVDGDTGKIIAAGSEMRGEKLDATIRAALEKKKGAQ